MSWESMRGDDLPVPDLVYPILVTDPRKVMEDYQAETLPTTVLIDTNGIIRDYQLGGRGEQEHSDLD